MAMQLMKSDIMQPIGIVLKSVGPEELISVLQVVASLAFASDSVAQKMLTKDLVKSLKVLCAHKNPEASPLTLNFLSKNSLVSMACQYYLGWYKMTIYLSLGSKVSFTSSWKSGILLGEPPISCYF